MGPLTAGFERWANLPPSQFNLQSFGHAVVAADGTLTIKLTCINGTVMFEKTLDPVTLVPKQEEPTPSASSGSTIFNELVGLALALLAYVSGNL